MAVRIASINGRALFGGTLFPYKAVDCCSLQHGVGHEHVVAVPRCRLVLGEQLLLGEEGGGSFRGHTAAPPQSVTLYAPNIVH